MNLISEALAQALPMVAAPFDWTGIIFAAIVVALVVYIIWIKRTPGVQIGEGLVDKLVAALHSNTTATQAATPTAPVITQADLQAAIAAALAARAPAAAALTLAAPQPAPAQAVEQVRQLAPAAPAPALLQTNPMPVQIPRPNPDGTMGTKWSYQGRNFDTQQEIIDFDIASAARDANLANIDHSPLPLTDEQVTAAIAAGGDPTARASWKNPSATYQSAVRIRDGLTPDDVNRRINEANGAGNYGIFPKG